MNTYRQYRDIYDVPDSAVVVDVAADETAIVRSKTQLPQPEYFPIREALENAHRWVGRSPYYTEVVIILQEDAEWSNEYGTLVD